MRKPTIWISDQVDTNWPEQSQKIARSLKFRMMEEEGLYYPCCKNKGVISFAVTEKLVCAAVYAYADGWFSYAAAQLSLKAPLCEKVVFPLATFKASII